MLARTRGTVIALLGSIAVHATALVTMPLAPPSTEAPVASMRDVEVTVAGPDVPSPVSASNAVHVRSAARAARSAVRPSSPPAPTTTGAVELQAPSSEQQALHFVMSVGAISHPAPSVAPSGGASEPQGESVYAEDGVDARPRLLAWQAPRYPPSAASAGVEVDVPVEVVIDTQGAVTDVRLPKHFGYGLDEAAIAAARSYRFSRATKAGRPVRVRMRCTVMFRLD
ncbi:MAG TPA: TonB family protein [Polyangiaceae bacterium]|nr:TonB family protein [Polyangiaceae bacterium]